jgi:GNAT superfamily N-acetyltransferase
LSTPVAEQSSSEGNFSELARLLDTHEAEITVREAAGMEGDCVAKMRCSVFGQGKDMYRSQRQKMRTSPHYLLAGIYKTTLMVAVVRALTPKARQVCKDVVLADMQQLLDQAWLSEREHAQLVEQFEHEWKERSELVIGSVDCSVHEMLDSSLTLRRWVYVSSMAVRNHLRRRGIGEKLLELAVTHARKIFGVKDMFLHVEVGLGDVNVAACAAGISAGATGGLIV